MKTIKFANASYLNKLTEIAFSAKKYWNYPDEYYEIWKDELTITENYLKSYIVKIIVDNADNNVIKGFYSFRYNESEKQTGEILIEKGYWLDHMFLEQKYIGSGLGKTMFIDLVNEIKIRNGIFFNIFVDPFAVGFYEKMGCKFIRESKSSIKDRNIPVYQYEII
ncbi:MAG: GNAT family N-acetyltransferase [Chitinispirillia bacterium]|nr:GNAT family N-acetyltransferase [Chitinispirillia bacterium]